MMREKEGWCACRGASDRFADTRIFLRKIKFKKKHSFEKLSKIILFFSKCDFFSLNLLNKL